MNGGVSMGKWRCWLAAGWLLWAAPGRADDFLFATNADNTITLTDYKGAGGDVVVPSHVSELPVVEIGTFAFLGCTALSSIELPDTLLRIARGAFNGCTNLSGIFIPAAVNSIEEMAFSWCLRMTAIDVDPNNADFESRNGVLFNEDCSVLIRCPGGVPGNYVVPEEVVELAPAAFSGCREMSGVEIPNGVRRIGESAFYGCAGLTNFLLPQSVTNVADWAIAGCLNLASITVDSNNPAYETVDGALLVKGGGEYVQCPGGRTGTYAIPAGATNIHAGAFSGCEGLTNIWFPQSVIAMRHDPFDGCFNLAAFEVDPLNPAFVSMDGVLYSKDLHILVRYPPGKLGPCVLLDSAAVVADGAFSYCVGLSQVTLGNTVTNVGAEAFLLCTNMAFVKFGSGVAYIHASAFVGCFILRELYFAGNAPNLESFIYFGFPTIYHLPGAEGWDALPWYLLLRARLALWLPRISEAGLGLQSGRFGFQMDWAAGHAVVVEACTNLAEPAWLPLATNELADGTGIFEDEEESNPVGRFYRVVPAP